MNRSASIKELAAALAKAQAEMTSAKRDSNNPHFKSRYADLASVWDAARPALTKHGLSIAQFTEPSQRDEVIVETTLMHESGEWISGRIAIPVDKQNAHGYGSALTYCRRYALAAAVGIAPEDDDGNAASQAPARQRTSEEDDGNAALQASARQRTQSEPPNGSARAVTANAFNALEDAAREALQRKAQYIQELYAAKGIVDAVTALHDLNLDTEGKLAIWWLFDSEFRSSIKREEMRRREKDAA